MAEEGRLRGLRAEASVCLVQASVHRPAFPPRLQSVGLTHPLPVQYASLPASIDSIWAGDILLYYCISAAYRKAGDQAPQDDTRAVGGSSINYYTVQCHSCQSPLPTGALYCMYPHIPFSSDGKKLSLAGSDCPFLPSR